MRLRLGSTLAAAGLTGVLASAPAAAADWPQIAHDARRTGYQPEKTPPPARIVWQVNLEAERIYPQQQVIIAGGRAFVGTLAGKLHALDARTGEELWAFTTAGAAGGNGAIIHSVGVEGGRVFVAGMDGNAYAVEAASGKPVWQFESGLRTGFSGAVLLAEGKVFLGHRHGTFYAISQQSGRKVWERPIGVPILGTAAYNEGRVYFGAEDIRMRALDAGTGKVLWTSEQLNGFSMKDFWPVVHRGEVLIRPWYGPKFKGAACDPNVWPFQWAGEKSNEFLAKHGKELGRGKLPAEVERGQDAAIATLTNVPEIKDLFVLDEKTGEEAMVVPHWACPCMNGAVAPPCVDRDGYLVIGIVLGHSYYGRLDIEKGRLVDIPWNASGERWGGGNGDENIQISAAGDFFQTVHFSGDHWAHKIGAFDLKNRRWHPWPGTPRKGVMLHNCQGAGGNPVSFADGMAYHQTWHRVYARAGR